MNSANFITSGLQPSMNIHKERHCSTRALLFYLHWQLETLKTHCTLLFRKLNATPMAYMMVKNIKQKIEKESILIDSFINPSVQLIDFQIHQLWQALF